MPPPRPPFHRRLLPWLFFIVFLGLAPALILYTAGYRYNTKKGLLERNGTLIIDSTPRGANVWIDDQDTKETTPVTFQNMAPGWHSIRVVRNGYLAWQKKLEVSAEQVTFANQIWFWKNASSTFLQKGPIAVVTSDPAREQLALIEQTVSSTTLRYWSPPSGIQSFPQELHGRSAEALTIDWRDDSRALLIEDLTDQTRAWVSIPRLTTSTLNQLPPALYTWSGSTLLGFADHTRLRVDPATGTVTKDPLPSSVLASTDEARLEQTTSSERLITTRFFQTRALELPSGHWMIDEWQKPFLLLRDGIRWLSINPSESQPFVDQLSGDHPRWLINAPVPTALFLNDREAWMWALGSTPVLLWRQSDPLVQIAWHRSGHSIFLADQHHLFALELDNRDGRLVTPLATFDHINDFAIVNKSIYVAGTKDTQKGLWRLDVE